MPDPKVVRLPARTQPKLLEQVRNELRARHYSRRTEAAYLGWIRRYIRFHSIRHPAEMGKPEIEGFLSDLAVKRSVAESTQNQAFNALLFLYREVLHLEFDWLDSVVRAKKPKHLPVVLTRDEVRRVMDHLEGARWLAVMILYGSGLRLLECLRLRVKDIDFGYRQILVRQGKGKKDRVTILPAIVEERLEQHLEQMKRRSKWDLRRGPVHVKLPGALDRKYPSASSEWKWQWVFPATRKYRDPRTDLDFRHHLHETVIQKAVKRAAAMAGLAKRVTCHTFRHYATHLLEDGYDIRTVQELLGHKDVSTTMIYTHVLNRGAKAIKSPADRF